MKMQKFKGSLGAGRHQYSVPETLEAQEEAAGAVPWGASTGSTTSGVSVTRGSNIECDGRSVPRDVAVEGGGLAASSGDGVPGVSWDRGDFRWSLRGYGPGLDCLCWWRGRRGGCRSEDSHCASFSCWGYLRRQGIGERKAVHVFFSPRAGQEMAL